MWGFPEHINKHDLIQQLLERLFIFSCVTVVDLCIKQGCNNDAIPVKVQALDGAQIWSALLFFCPHGSQCGGAHY